jgi:ethanolamine utilization protein EutA
MHDTDFLHEHSEMSEADRAEIARYIWNQETVELKTVGIDIGSSTSHLLFASVTLQRKTQDLSSRYVVIDRQIIWRSPIMLTPFRDDGTIDAHELDHFIARCYREAGLKRVEIDSGAVILTGEAIKRKNARAIDELFADQAGKFVCASAGHKLECRLAAHGSGAVRLSQERGICLLHVDVGGGTTKLALIDRGKVLGVSAFAVGGRLLACDEYGRWTRIDESARLAATDLGLSLDLQKLSDEVVRQQVARRLAQVAADFITDAPRDALGDSLRLTDDLLRPVKPMALTFSGGVSEYIFEQETRDYSDIARLLACELTAELSKRTRLPLIDPGQRIRATVIGASQFTVQVSGKTIYLPKPELLPLHNVPVVHVEIESTETDAAAICVKLNEMDLAPDAQLAIAFAWTGDPEHKRLTSAARAIMEATAPNGRRHQPLLLMIDGDVGKTFGQLLHDELDLQGDVISVDGVHLHDLDFVDVGEPIPPAGVVPIVIKSLLFHGDAHAHRHARASVKETLI